MPETLETDSSLRTLRGTVGDICQGGRAFDLYTKGMFDDPVTVYLNEPDPSLAVGREVEVSIEEMETGACEVNAKSIRYV